MHPAIRIFSLISILSLTLGSLTGCGEKRIHVATVSGAPGEEMALETTNENSEAQMSGLDNSTVEESTLSSQIPEVETASEEPVESDMIDEPINMVHEPQNLSTQEGPLDSSQPDPSLESPLSSDNDESVPSLGEGQDFSAQSSSSPKDRANRSLANIGDFQEPTPAQFSELHDTPSREDMERIPDTFQIAKAEPSDSLQDQMNRIKEEEFATAAAGLEDVFFQFDSWALTHEGRQSLQRTLGWFEQEPSSNLIIEGHADQRGTQAYNMVLAKKRAVAVHDYLSQLGVDASRLAVISYGKDKPFCQDATEVCYQLNRRGHLIVQNP